MESIDKRVLLPPRHNRVMDLVADTGIDVSDWANYKGRSPAANPKYCYEWVHRDARTTAVCLWYEDIHEGTYDTLHYRLNARLSALRAQGHSQLASRTHRARLLDDALREAFANSRPLRVIVVDGAKANIEQGSIKSSRVQRRLLDPLPWHVAKYEAASGECLLLRAPPRPRYADQFTAAEIEAESGSRQRTVTVRDRSRAVRTAVLDRAAGRCEYCGAAGFLRADGYVYLETHHVIPLHAGGPDSTSNVVALCPNHHREAHQGAAAERIRAFLLQHLA